MKTEETYLKDIAHIRNIMDTNTRFLSLSGLSGIIAGAYAIIGSLIAKRIITSEAVIEYGVVKISYDTLYKLVGIALGVLFLSVLTGFILTRVKANKNGEKIWTKASKKMLFNFSVPLLTGGIFCISLINQSNFGIIAPATLIFYGIALFNASKYTLTEVKYLGLSEIILGLIAMNFIGYGLYFWALGFGALHIVYGAIMYFKNERK